jgi:flavin-dependent dehydrogenase
MAESVVFDVLIVGAGPAGCAAAIRAATSGLRVALIEKARFPRDLPGEALHPDVNLLFAELGVAAAISRAGFMSCPGWILQRSSDRSFVPFVGQSGLQFGYQAWRSEMDSILLARARRQGVTVVQPAGGAKVFLDGPRVAGLETAGQRWHCRHLVDASGAARLLARSLRLPLKDFSPRLVARYAYFDGDCDLGIIPEFREHACGWTWLARVRKDCCQCVQLSLAADAGRSPAPPPPFDCLPPDVRFRGADVTWRLAPECAGAGYYLCGDAAAVLDPAASSGVARALASGLKAADLIVQVTKKRTDPLVAAAVYRQWCAKQFVEQARQLASRYAELEEPPVWLDGLERRFAELEEFLSNPLANCEKSAITSFGRSQRVTDLKEEGPIMAKKAPAKKTPAKKAAAKTSNLATLTKAGVVPADYPHFTPAEKQAIESLTVTEVTAIISTKTKLGPQFFSNHATHGMFY